MEPGKDRVYRSERCFSTSNHPDALDWLHSGSAPQRKEKAFRTTDLGQNNRENLEVMELRLKYF